MKSTIFAILLFHLPISTAKAEGACPPDYYQTTPPGPGPIGCAPIPSHGGSAVKWQGRWGAFASDGEGNWGISSEKTDKQKAKSAAIEDCLSRSEKECAIRFTYDNQCAAIAMTTSSSHMASDKTEDSAIAKATANCKSKDQGKCWIYYSGCSLPVQSN